jgi:hypothetical protein
MRNLRQLALWIALGGLVGCDAHTSASGIVLDGNGAALQGASVRLSMVKSGRTLAVNTSQDGTFEVGMTHGPFAGRFDVLISKPGFVTYRQEIPANTRQELRIVLSRAAESSPASTPQSIVQQMFPNAPTKADSVECFRALTPEMSIYLVVQKCGRPDEETGSGLYIFVYHLKDKSTVAVGTPSLDRIYDITYTDPFGKSTSLLRSK